jgi:5-methyltetrahydropteroyltriglutamate--homocysteine methyltransferase
MVTAANLGFPRIGPRRELKKALEGFWAGNVSEEALLETAREIRQQNWRLQQEAGIEHIPSNDFSLYDHVLDTIAMVGAVPARYGWRGDRVDRVDLGTYFAMARGVQRDASANGSAVDLPAMEMTKWYDTNYHYIVPEFEAEMHFRLASTKPVDAFVEAKALGIITRPVLIGPMTFLLLGKMHDHAGSRFDPLPNVLPIYEEILRRLDQAGAEWVQIDEPCLATDLDAGARAALALAYERLAVAAPRLRILVATYFGTLNKNLEAALRLPVAALHLDVVRAPEQLDQALAQAPTSMALSLGVVDGRNVWRTDLDRALDPLERAAEALGSERVIVAPSCSLLHSPIDLDLEKKLDPGVRLWLAFAKQKVGEVALLVTALRDGREAIGDALAESRRAVESRRTSPRIHDAAVQRRLASVTEEMFRRGSPYDIRRRKQVEALRLPPFPTTTIGSLPQTGDVRAVRAEFRAGKRDRASYERFVREQIGQALRFQEEIGLDVLVHGESERNDMVEYFGEQLAGFAITQNGWVQSYGSRYVKPPIIYGDTSRPAPMTVEWSRYAQSLTSKPVKGMLTGPVTILKWSFVRDDQPRDVTCRQIALAIRDEVADLEAAGIRIIQIDEPALREGLPLRRADWGAYLEWAVAAFRLASSGVRDETQVHTHMCYAEFSDIIDAIAAMDADVLAIETTRSQMELLDTFAQYRYPNEIGPGVYDIHSPRVPTREEMEGLLDKALAVLSPEQIWVNPDCGLKTRRWEEVRPSLTAMVEAARGLRARAGAVAGR